MIEIKRLPVGIAEANCYIVSNGKEALIVDPGDQRPLIAYHIEQLNVKPIAILLTHTHYDHIGALEIIRENYGIPVYVSAKEQDWLSYPSKNLSSFTGNEIIAREAEYVFEGTEEVEIADFQFKVVPTPGHSPGGISFVFAEEAFVITGDALFAGSIGRTDLPGSNSRDLFTSIRENLFELPSHYKIYPGHGKPSTIGTEIDSNPFFN